MVQVTMFIIFYTLLLTGYAFADNSSYDYSVSIDCLAEPLDPQYGGGIVENPKFDSGVGVWTKFGYGKIESRKSNKGNNYLVAYNRTIPSDGLWRSFDIQKDILYTFSAWLQLNKGNEIVSANLLLPNEKYQIVGSVIAKSGCWSMLKGGFQLDQDMTVRLIFSSETSEVEIWLDNVSLKPFTRLEWQDQQNKTIEQVRKRTIRINVSSLEGKKIQGAAITIHQMRPYFQIGCSSTEAILTSKGYQDWFKARFPVTSFNNEMKWYFIENYEGLENYTVPDAMLSFFKQNGISVRGHNILWDRTELVPNWVRPLSPQNILKAAVNRMGSVMSRYSGDVIAWDVMNENLHYSFYEDKLGQNVSAIFYQIAHALDVRTRLFLNEYNTLAFPADKDIIPSKYVEKLRQIQSFPGNEETVIGIGLQGHFLLRPNVSYIRAALDVLGATKMPIWLTELDTKKGPNQALELEEVIREAFSHPAVEGIIVWAGWKPTACSESCLTNSGELPKACAQMCLTNNNFTNLPTGDVVDKLIKEWKTTNVTGITDINGTFEEKVFLGEYSLTYSHPQFNPDRITLTFNVTSGEGPLELSVSF